MLKTINGDAYIKQYNYKMLPGTGPYTIAEQDVAKGQSITIRRRKDYWAENERRNVGTSNFDRSSRSSSGIAISMFEMFKKGDLDYCVVERAQMWVEELNYPNIKRGLNQKRKIFNAQSQGMAGAWMNTRREPYNDVRVRKALRHLYNRELMVEKMMFNQYVLEDSIFPGSVYENPEQRKNALRPAEGRPASGRGRMEGSRCAGTARPKTASRWR